MKNEYIFFFSVTSLMKRETNFFLHSSRKTQRFFFSLDFGINVAWRFLSLYFLPHINVGEERNEFYGLCFHTFFALLLVFPQLGLCINV